MHRITSTLISMEHIFNFITQFSHICYNPARPYGQLVVVKHPPRRSIYLLCHGRPNQFPKQADGCQSNFFVQMIYNLILFKLMILVVMTIMKPFFMMVSSPIILFRGGGDFLISCYFMHERTRNVSMAIDGNASKERNTMKNRWITYFCDFKYKKLIKKIFKNCIQMV